MKNNKIGKGVNKNKFKKSSKVGKRTSKTLNNSKTPILIFSGIFAAIFICSIIIYKASEDKLNSNYSSMTPTSTNAINQSQNAINSPVSSQVENQVSNQVNSQVDNTLNQNVTPQVSDSSKSSSEAGKEKSNWNEQVEKLKAQGTKTQDIEAAKQYVQGIVFELNQIVSFDSGTGNVPQPGAEDNPSEDSTKYSQLSEKINIDEATYYMIGLKDLLGSKEKVFDEYLLSLQLDLDLSEISKDKSSYEKKKSEKMTGLDQNSIITAEQIEQKMLESLQKQNEKNRNTIPEQNSDINGINNNLPNSQMNNLPGVEVPKVVDPAEELRKKIGQ